MGRTEGQEKPISDNSGLKLALDRLERLTVNLVKRPPTEPPAGSDNPVHSLQATMRDAFEQPQPAAEPAADAPAPQLLSMKQAAAITTLSVSSIKRMMAAGTFPQPVRLGESRIAFVDGEIHAWIRQRIAARR